MLCPGAINNLCFLLTFFIILKYFNVTRLTLFTPIGLTNTTVSSWERKQEKGFPLTLLWSHGKGFLGVKYLKNIFCIQIQLSLISIRMWLLGSMYWMAYFWLNVRIEWHSQLYSASYLNWVNILVSWSHITRNTSLDLDRTNNPWEKTIPYIVWDAIVFNLLHFIQKWIVWIHLK